MDEKGTRENGNFVYKRKSRKCVITGDDERGVKG